MARDRRAFLWDIRQAASEILSFTSRKTESDYTADAMLRAAVERKLEIIGEAVRQYIQYFPESANEVTQSGKIIALRNRLIHGYASVSDTLIWEIVKNDIPVLHEQANALLSAEDKPSGSC